MHVTHSKNRNFIYGNQSAFTLIEILIVIIILGIIAIIILPTITDSSDAAKLNTLIVNLRHMRSAIELYSHQHNNVYPGQNTTDGSKKAIEAANDAAKGFVVQLTMYTSANGKTSSTKDATYKYGPYLKSGMPVNPYNNMRNVVCDTTTTDITVRLSDGKTGWKFYTKTGVFIANDGAHDKL